MGTGAVFDPAIRATAAMTLAPPKAGLRTPRVAAVVIEGVYVILEGRVPAHASMILRAQRMESGAHRT
jgi:hypothetical protein